MMTCPSCGQIVDETGVQPGWWVPCPRCGAPQTVPIVAAPDPRTSKSAMTALTLSIVGHVPLAAPLAMLLGIAGIVIVRRSKGALGGFGLALTGIILGAGWCLAYFLVLLAFAGPYWFGGTNSEGCKRRVAEIDRALREFRNRNGYEARSLEDLVRQGLIREEDTSCPAKSNRYTLIRYDLAAEDDMRLHDGGDNHGGLRVILTYEGEVRFRDEGSFEAERDALGILKRAKGF